MIKSFFASRKWMWWAYLGGAFLLASLYAQVYMSVMINDWYRGFYDILQKATEHEVSELWDSLLLFMYIAMPYVLLATVTAYFTRLYAFRWREAITFNYVNRWNPVNEIEGSAQRIQQDTERFAKIMESLGLQVIRAIMTLVAFLPVLWTLSEDIKVPLLPEFMSDGSLVWVAIITSLGGLLISWKVGCKLPGLEYNNQKVEAAYRQNLELVSTHKLDFSLLTITELFTGLKFNYHRLFLHYGYFDIWLNLYDQFMVIIPYMVAGSGLFTGAITLGVIIQISNAFQKVHGSFSLFIFNWTTITELRSVIKRLKEFEGKLD